MKHNLITTRDGGVEADPQRLVACVAEALDLTLAQARSREESVAAVAVSVLAASLVGLDADRRAVTPVYTYADVRNTEDAVGLRAEFDNSEVCDRTGCPLHASYLPSRFRWLGRTQPHITAMVDRWVSFGEYLYGCTFGRSCGLTVSVAAWSGLLDRRTMDWDPVTLDAIGIDPGVLGRVDVEGVPVRGLIEPWASRWPALGDAAWFPPLPDGMCSNIGTMPLESQSIVVCIGTSAAVRAILPGPVPTVPHGLWEYRIGSGRSIVGGRSQMAVA